jgi:hypothetical protein
MVAKSTCVFAIAITLVFCGSNVQGLVTDNPIKDAIEQAVADAMSSETHFNILITFRSVIFNFDRIFKDDHHLI